MACLDQVAVHPRGARAAHEDECLARQVAKPHVGGAAAARPLGHRVARGQRHEQLLEGDLVVGDRTLLRHRAPDERDVEAAGGDRLGELRGVAFHDLQLHGGMGFPVAADEVRGETVRDGGTREAERQAARGALRGLRPARHAAPDGRQDGARFLEEHGPPFRELDSPRKPAQERVAELALEVAHLLRERRLLDAQDAGRAREASRLGNGHEIAQVSQFHRRSPSVIDLEKIWQSHFLYILQIAQSRVSWDRDPVGRIAACARRSGEDVGRPDSPDPGQPAIRGKP